MARKSKKESEEQIEKTTSGDERTEEGFDEYVSDIDDYEAEFESFDDYGFDENDDAYGGLSGDLDDDLSNDRFIK